MKTATARHGLVIAAVALALVPASVAIAEQVFWLDDDGQLLDSKTGATDRLQVADERDGLGWPAQMYRISDDTLSQRGYISSPKADDSDAHWVGHYERYRPDGEHRLHEVGTTDAQGRQQGLTTIFDDQGEVEYQILYRDDERHGKTRQYLHGTLYSVTDYAHGKREGVHAQYVQGQLRRIEEYRNDQIDGVAEQYTISSEAGLSTRVHYRDGKPHGWAREYRAGSLISEAHYTEGKHDGPVRYWHDQAAGQLRKLAHYRNGERVGEQINRRYDVDNQLFLETILDADNEKIATTKFDRVTGEPTSIKRHVTGPDGEPREIHRYFDPYGYVKTRITLIPGQARKIEVHFETDGKLNYRRELHNSDRVGHYFQTEAPGETVDAHYDQEGELHGVKTSIANDEKYSSYTYVHGTLSGPYQRKVDRDRIAKGTYLDGRLEGPRREFVGDQLVEIAHYEHNRRNGDFASYFDSGKLRAKGQYVNGDKHGDWIEHGDRGQRWQGTYDHDTPVGHWQATNAWGYTVEQGMVDDQGRRTGLWALYEDNGKLEDCPLYREGERVAFPNYDYDSGQTAVEYCNNQLEAEPH